MQSKNCGGKTREWSNEFMDGWVLRGTESIQLIRKLFENPAAGSTMRIGRLAVRSSKWQAQGWADFVNRQTWDGLAPVMFHVFFLGAVASVGFWLSYPRFRLWRGTALCNRGTYHHYGTGERDFSNKSFSQKFKWSFLEYDMFFI